MERQNVQVGDHVLFTDSKRQDHSALITMVFRGPPGTEHPENPPAVNLVYVVADEDRDDQYGRQIERETSCVHRMMNAAEANCWRLPGE